MTMIAKQESPADSVKPARRKSMQKLLQFDVFSFHFTEFHFPEFQITKNAGAALPPIYSLA